MDTTDISTKLSASIEVLALLSLQKEGKLQRLQCPKAEQRIKDLAVILLGGLDQDAP